MANAFKPSIVFRVDGSTRIGSGHVMRCLTLADAAALRGLDCIFVSRDIHPNLVARIESAGHILLALSKEGPPAPVEAGLYGEWLGTTETHDAHAALYALKSVNHPTICLVVVDHYGLGKTWETVIGSRLDARILTIDDINRRHASDFILDVTLGKSATDYVALARPGTQALIGASYALLRPDFAQLRINSLAERDRRLAEGKVEHILVSMGGADESNATLWIAKALAILHKADSFHVHLLTGAAYPHMDALLAFRAQHSDRTTIHSNVANVAELLSGMDLAIGAAGSSSWERCCLGLPTINLVLAENQLEIAASLAAAGACIDGGQFRPATDQSDWAKGVVEPALESAKMTAISQAARQTVDGRGTSRVISAIFADRIRRYSLTLRAASIDDATLLFEWQCHPATRAYALNPAAPVWEQHVDWLRLKISDSRCHFYIAEVGGIAAGVVRLDPSNSTPPYCAENRSWREISTLTAPEFYGCGVASRMLAALQFKHADEVLVARVLDRNVASRRLFAKAGFSSYAPELLSWQQ